MKIDDLIQLLNNRLREFQLSRDYAKMSGNLERMNTADKEIIGLEDTIYQLSLLMDTSKSAAAREATLAEAMTDGSIAVLGEYDIAIYATDPKHEEKVMNILSKMPVLDTIEKIDKYIKDRYLGSPVTGEMVMSASLAYDVDIRLMVAMMEQDSSLGTAGLAVRTLNPGNVGNDDDGNTRTYESWQEGVTAVAEWLSRHRGSTIIPETPEETIFELIEPEQPTATTTSTTTTSTTTTSTTTPITSSTSSPQTATSTPATTSTSTPTTTSTTTPTTASSTPATTSTSTPSTGSGPTATTTSTTTPTTASSTPTTTSTPATTLTTGNSGSTAATSTSTPTTIPTISPTTITAPSTPATATSTSN